MHSPLATPLSSTGSPATTENTASASVPPPFRSGENLWELAVAKLKPEDRQLADFANPDKSAALHDLLVLTGQKRAFCIERRLKFTRKDGQVVVLPDLFDKITTWVEKFIEIGNVIAQYDPAHAALPWAGIRFILQIAVNDSQKFGAVLEALEIAAHTIAHNAIVEQIYMNYGPLAAGLREALVKLYARVLHCLAKANHYYGKSSLRRLAGSIIELPASFQKAVDDIKTAQLDVDAAARLIDAESQRELSGKLESLSFEQKAKHSALHGLLEDLEKPIRRLDARVSDSHDDLESPLSRPKSKRRDLLKWLSMTPYEQHHENIRRGRLEDSCTWLLEKNAYKQWKKSSSPSILWLHGITGCGKTKLISAVIDSFKGVSPATEALAYFYCARNPAEPERADPGEILRSIVRQLSCLKPGHPIMEPITIKYSQREEDSFGLTKLTFEECLELIIELAELYPSTTIILDALDECIPDTRHELLQALDDIIQKSAGLVKILVSSRDNQDIVCRLRDSPNLYVHRSDNSEDIRRFVRQEVWEAVKRGRLLRGSVSDDLARQVIHTLVEGAQGMFRWVSLQLQHLCGPKIVLEDDLLEEMGKLPRDLADIYPMIYEQVSELGPRSHSVAVRALKWLLCAERPLSAAEFIAAASVDSEGVHTRVSESQMLELCCNLIVLDTDLNIFRFAHLSVREYLEKREEYALASTHATAAERCLVVCLANSRFTHLVPEAATANRIFENYAVLHWATHCQMSGGQRRSEGRLGKMFREFTEDFAIIPSYEEWTALATLYLDRGPTLPYPSETKLWQMVSSPADPIFAACIWGFSDVVENLLKRNGVDLSKRNDGGDTCLYLASEHGHYWIAQGLVAKGASVDAKGGYYGNALQASVAKGHDTISQLLLDGGADINAQGGYYGNALQAASRHDRPKVVKRLLDLGADINAQGGNWSSALQAAACTGNIAIAQHLLDRGADIHMQGGCCGNALQAAAWGSYEEIVQALLDRGADINSLGGIYGGALQAALIGTDGNLFPLPSQSAQPTNPQATYDSRTRQVRLICMLISKGADINAQGGYYGNPLQAALARSLERLVPMLLEKGADVNALGGQFGCPLQAAARYTAPSTVQLLLDHGADVNAQGGYYGNALQAACHRGDAVVVLLLLEKGANVNARGGTWGLPLRAAVKRGHGRVARILVDWGARVAEMHTPPEDLGPRLPPVQSC
ncbi:MAG: hypothetical protein M1839_002451 [Geoglossum umbratile]|nr:MAG: hypothetical protein M1839_002451 [Geoglossum umbratile]